jgi:diguanylate cyclase (GGDEF)-like protein
MGWIIEPEYTAAILLAILIGYSFLWNRAQTFTDRVFRACLLISLSSILTNIVGIFTIENPQTVSLWVNNLINSLYFAFSACMLGSIAAYTLLLLFEGHVEDKRLKWALSFVGLVLAIQIALVFVNLKTGCLFHFDEQLRYIRGPLNKTPYMGLVVDAMDVVGCYFLVRGHVRRTCEYALVTVPLLAAGLSTIQLTSPNTMLSGSAAAMSLLALFIYGQQEGVHVDHLTELCSRENFYRTLEKYTSRERLFYAMIISLRDFKQINIRYGQRTGDAVLRAIGRYVLSIKGKVVACRFSGVEFSLILTDISDFAYEEVFQAVCARFQQPWDIEGKKLMLRAAVADVAYPECARDGNTLIASLEYAARLAKATGKPMRFDKQLQREFGRRNYVIGLLEPALWEGGYYPVFQPVVDAQTGLPLGAEVLLRLKDPYGGTIFPGEFIPLAEEMDLITSIDWMVLEMAIQFFSLHKDCGLKWFSVNVSSKQYENRDAVSRILALVDRYHLPPGMLKLEITERLIIEDIDAAKDTIQMLKAAGVGVCLDDFGTGYSNLAITMTLPLEYVKIDKSLVERVTTDPSAHRMLVTIVRGLKEMGMATVAEGVETQQQKDVVLALGVEEIQGFYYMKPLEEETFLAYMASRGGNTGNLSGERREKTCPAEPDQ